MTGPTGPTGPGEPERSDPAELWDSVVAALRSHAERLDALETIPAHRGAQSDSGRGTPRLPDDHPWWVQWLVETYRLPVPDGWACDEALVAELAALREAYEAATNHDPTSEPSTQLLVWHEALDRARRRLGEHTARRGQELDDLARWVEWLRDRYGLADLLPPDWSDDPWLLDELHAAHQAHRAAAHAPDPSPQWAAWRDTLARTTQRLRDHAAATQRAAAAQPDLATWVEWLISTYPELTTIIPTGWTDWPAIRDELAALHHAWRAAQHSPDPSTGWVTFYEALARACGRIRDWKALGRKIAGTAATPQGADGSRRD